MGLKNADQEELHFKLQEYKLSSLWETFRKICVVE